MGQALRSPRFFTVEEYLAHVQQIGKRLEYVNGVIYATAGCTDRHNLTAANVSFELKRQMRSLCKCSSTP